MKKSTQSLVPAKEIRNGIIVRDDGVLCAAILVSAINFDLRSFDEQEAILFQFQNMLNSLESSTQILIQSRKLNILPYLDFLEKLYKQQDVELLRIQTREYINFIKDFTESHEIMSKRFFVLVSYSPLVVSGGGFFKKASGAKKKDKGFEEAKSQLLQRVSFIESSIHSLGLRTVVLGTDELIELLYQTFNPGDTQKVPTDNI